MILLLSTRAALTPPAPLLTAAEARALGIDVAHRGYTRLRRGVYAEARAVAALPPWERYALRVHAS